MAVKYVKDFEFSSDRGFHKSAEPMKAKASYGDMPARAKPNAAAMGAKKMESAPGRAKYAAGGRTSYAALQAKQAATKAREEAFRKANSVEARAAAARAARGLAPRDPSKPAYTMDDYRRDFPSKKPVAPTRKLRPAPTMTIMPVPMSDDGMVMAKKGGKVEKVMREYKEGKLHSGSKKGPVVKDRKQAVAIALSEARKSGAKIPKKAEGGIFSTEYMASKGPKTRGTPRKGREMGRKDRMDRMALEKMRKAEKYAPGLSIDMPDRKAHGGMPKSRKMMYGGGKC